MLTEEIQKAISESLPQQVGEVLQKRLSQADTDKEALEKLTEKAEQLERELDEIRKWKYDAKKNEDDKRRLESERQAFEIEKANNAAKLSEEKFQFSREVLMGMVRNIEHRKTLFNGAGTVYTTDHNGVCKPVPSTLDQSETKE